jgi:hypothetical protein
VNAFLGLFDILYTRPPILNAGAVIEPKPDEADARIPKIAPAVKTSHDAKRVEPGAQKVTRRYVEVEGQLGNIKIIKKPVSHETTLRRTSGVNTKTGCITAMKKSLTYHRPHPASSCASEPFRSRFPGGKRAKWLGCKVGTLKPYRPLTKFEQHLLRRKGMENDPIVIAALNIFEGRVVG